MKTLLCCALLAAPLAAQKDFLTAGEIAQVRQTQEPNARLTLYTSFARQRLETVVSLLAKDKPGRSILIHDALDSYAKILDAIDDVADEAAARNTDVRKGLAAVASGESSMVSALERIRDSRPPDLDRYAFVLDQAIATTSGSLAAAEEDPGARGADVRARQEKEQQARKAEMAPSGGDSQKSAQAQTPAPQKPPTLLRPGEKPPSPPPPQ